MPTPDLIGLIISSGPAGEKLPDFNLDKPDELRVKLIPWQRPEYPDDANYLRELESALRGEGCVRVAFIGSSRGAAPTTAAVADDPTVCDGGYVNVSGAGDVDWNAEAFVAGVNTPVFQMYGSDDLPGAKIRMDAIKVLLDAAGKDNHLVEYEGQTHGFLARYEPAQSDLHQFLSWTLGGGTKPVWWPN